MFKSRAVLFAVFLSFGLVACGDDESPVDNNTNNTSNNNTTNALEVIGVWETIFGNESITAETWGTYQGVVFFDNMANFAVTQNLDDADFDPGLFNRIVWTEIQNDEFHYCTVAFGLESEEVARTSDANADETDLDGEGCGGFPWTKMTRQ